jgi:adenylate cyclase
VPTLETEATMTAINPSPATAPQPSQADAPILLAIDNDPLALELLTRTLSREAVRVVTALSGEEGLRLAQELKPAVITLDVDMPGMDGWQVLAALKADPQLAPIPVIMATMIDDRTKGAELGVADYLVKPFKRERLAAVLSKVQRQAPGAAERTVLVIEDDRTTRELLVRMLRREGCTVREAVNGRTALRQLAEAVPTLILLDLMLPELDGFGFLQELRKTPAYRAIPIVVSTAKDLSADDHSQLQGAVVKVFQKGASSINELLRIIRSQVSGGQ